MIGKGYECAVLFVPMSTALEISNVDLSLGGGPILSDLQLSVRTGRVHALLGRNGAGKSTTFKATLGRLPIDAGSIRLLDGDPQETRYKVGSSINDPALYPHLSAADNLRVHCLALGLPRTEIARVLHRVGLTDTGRKAVRGFSTGMKARLALAIALLGSPELLILDEPQNGLDPQGIRDLRDMFREYTSHGGTIIISSHQLGEVAKMADDVTVIGGTPTTTVFSGTLEELTRDGDIESRFLDLTDRTA